MPEVDEEGGCRCDNGFLDLNVLGCPSCVPVKAHLAFGCVGMVLSVAALGHATYHLDRQVSAMHQGEISHN